VLVHAVWLSSRWNVFFLNYPLGLEFDANSRDRGLLVWRSIPRKLWYFGGYDRNQTHQIRILSSSVHHYSSSSDATLARLSITARRTLFRRVRYNFRNESDCVVVLVLIHRILYFHSSCYRVCKTLTITDCS